MKSITWGDNVVEFVTKEEFDRLELDHIKLEKSVKNMKMALSMILDLFDEEDFAKAIAKKERASNDRV